MYNKQKEREREGEAQNSKFFVALFIVMKPIRIFWDVILKCYKCALQSDQSDCIDGAKRKKNGKKANDKQQREWKKKIHTKSNETVAHCGP